MRFVFSGTVLLVRDMFHPLNDFSVEAFLNGDVRHTCGGRSSVPVLFTGQKPHNVTWPNLLDRTAFALRPARARCDDESLSKRMCVPRGTRAGFERYAGALNTWSVHNALQVSVCAWGGIG